jgi:hypothetical protein
MSVAYTVPELSDPADAPQAFRDFADSISGVSDTLSVLPLAVNTTLSAGEDGYLLTVDTSGGDIEVTVPDNASVPLPVGYVVAIANLGGSTNVVKIKKGTGVNIQDQGFLQVEDYRITTLVKVSTDFWLLQAGSATYTPPAGPGAAVFDEGASTGATFYTLTDPDGDGKNYRCAEFLSSGTLVMSEGGFFDTWLGGPGGRGGYTGQGGVLGDGGGCGGVLELRELMGNAGSYTVTVGTQTGTAGGIGTSIEGPLPAPLTKITASAGSGPGSVTTPGATGSLTTTYTSYAAGTAGSGYGAGAAGTGGSGNGRFGGPAATYSGWAQSDFQFGAGGSSQYGPTSGAANSGDGGDGSEYSSYGTGGSGRAYVRVEV